MIGVVAKIDTSFSLLSEKLIDLMNLDSLRRWYLYVNMDRELFSFSVANIFNIIL